MMVAINTTAQYQLIKIMMDAKYMIDGLTGAYLHTGEDDGWIENTIKLPPSLKAAHTS
jgi:hypothetical protein